MALVGVLIAVGALVLAPPAAPLANAADPSQFDPGNIISDANFFDGSAMDAVAVQSFLTSKVPSCRSSYACLFSYVQATPSMAPVDGRCGAYTGSPAEHASDIIAKVGAACGISQRVLLVLLEKEQGLVTSNSPSQTLFDRATGMACPDTAPCAPAYSGFFYQVYYAAWQFKAYQAQPTSFNYRAGRVNSILYSPNTSCGRGDIYIVNDATAGLYDYTPYQPNAAALNNLYGTGDDCSSYGNRNFWRLYSDWFGSPTSGGNLVRTLENPAVYLLSGKMRHLIVNLDMLSAYSVLGAVGFVTQSVIDSYTLGAPASHIVRDPTGGIFLQDAGYRLLFTTCDLVVDYGGSCSADGYTQLTNAQIAKFLSGPDLGPVLRTNTGGRYYLKAGVRHEIVDEQTEVAAGLPISNQVLTENALTGVPLGSPMIRNGVIVADRQNGEASYYSGGKRYAMSATGAAQIGAAGHAAGGMLTASLAMIQVAGSFTGVVTGGGDIFVLTSTGRYRWVPATGSVPVSVPVSDEVLNSYHNNGSISTGSFVKGWSSSTVFQIGGLGARPVVNWATFVAFNGADDPSAIVVLPDAVAGSLHVGPPLLRPGSLVKSTSSPSVYFVDGATGLIFLSDFAIAADSGVTGYSVQSDSDLSAYAIEAGQLGWVYSCGGTYLAADGALHAMTATLVLAYGLTPRTVDTTDCALMPIGQSATPFIRLPSGAIYYMRGGLRHVVSSMARFGELGGAVSGYLNVSALFASALPEGNPA